MHIRQTRISRRETAADMHIGSMIRQTMELRGRSVVWLAKEYGCSRVNMYKIFEKQSIDTQALLRLSVLLDFDFFELYRKELHQRMSQKKQLADELVI